MTATANGKSWRAIQIIAVICAGIFPSIMARAQGADSLESQLAAKYKLVKLGTDSSGLSVLDAGTVLVIKKGAHRRQTAQAIYRRLLGVGQAVDVVVLTPDDVERYRHCVGMVVEQSVNRPPDRRAVFRQDQWPIVHLALTSLLPL